jgi:plasmid stabilization system protein ParE
VRELVLTDTAKTDIEQIENFLETQFNVQVKLAFLLKLAEYFDLIEQMPFMFQASQKSDSNIRRCVIHKNCAVYYKVTDTLIIILSVLDTRINPSSSKF